jgi:hypothetical protein
MASAIEIITRLIKPASNSTTADITRIRRTHNPRVREQQPSIGQPLQDTVPGTGSGDQ